MCKLTGVELNQAVAQGLGLPHVVEVRGAEGTPIAVWCLDNGLQPVYAAGPFDPSLQYEQAMCLQHAHNITVIRRASAEGDWVAGFNFSFPTEFDDTVMDCLSHAARGITPQLAICRAIVQRHTDQAAAAANQKAATERQQRTDEQRYREAMDAQQEDWQAQLRAQGYAETAGGWVKDEATPTLRVFPAKPTGAALSGHTLKFDGDH